MITFSSKGDFKKTFSFFEKMKEGVHLGNLDKYGREALEKTITEAISMVKLTHDPE